jgi:FkbM family methyltransferase
MGLKDKVRNSLRSWGWEVTRSNINTSERALMEKLLKYYSVDIVIDVGANVGQYSFELMAAGYTGVILSFEPIKEAFDQLKLKAMPFPQWQVYHFGVGSSIQELEMNISQNLVSSSILGITQTTVQAEPLTRYIRKEKVSMITLDSFFEGKKLGSFRAPLLKLDVQGFELEVLKGAISLLPKIKLIQSELSFLQLYEGGPLYDEVFSFMKKNNFEIYTLMPGFRDPDSGRMLQADGIFINTKF